MEASLPWADKAVLRHWVVESIEAFEVAAMTALDSSFQRVNEETFVGGVVSGETLSQAVRASRAKTVIQLIPFPEPEGTDLSRFMPEGTVAKFVPTGPPAGDYSTASAATIIAEIQGAAKPVLVLCRTGTRATAAVDLARAEAEGLSAVELEQRARSEGRAWTEREDVSAWIRGAFAATM